MKREFKEAYSIPSFVDYERLPESLRSKEFMFLQTPQDVDKGSQDYGRFVYGVYSKNGKSVIDDSCETDYLSKYISLAMHPDFKSKKYDWDANDVFILKNSNNEIVLDDNGEEVCFYEDGVHPQTGEPIVHYVLGFNRDNLECDVVITEPIACDNYFNGPKSAMRNYLEQQGRPDIYNDQELNAYEYSELNTIKNRLVKTLELSVPVLDVIQGSYSDCYCAKTVCAPVNLEDYDRPELLAGPSSEERLGSVYNELRKELDRRLEELSRPQAETDNEDEVSKQFDKDFKEEMEKEEETGNMDEDTLGFDQAPYVSIPGVKDDLGCELTAKDELTENEDSERDDEEIDAPGYEDYIAEQQQYIFKLENKLARTQKWATDFYRQAKLINEIKIAACDKIEELYIKINAALDGNKDCESKMDRDRLINDNKVLIDTVVKFAKRIKEENLNYKIMEAVAEDFDYKIKKLKERRRAGARYTKKLMDERDELREKAVAADEGAEAMDRLYLAEKEIKSMSLQIDFLTSQLEDKNIEIKAKDDKIAEFEDLLAVKSYEAEDRSCESINDKAPIR